MRAAAIDTAETRPNRSARTPHTIAPTAWLPWNINMMKAITRALIHGGSTLCAAIIHVLCTPTHAAPTITISTKITSKRVMTAMPVSTTAYASDPVAAN
jgi:hypothetical protein